MKELSELSVEEKAKRFDEAIEMYKARQEYECQKVREFMEYLFPELKESNDEMIRKALIKYYSFDKDGGSHALDNITPNQIVAWLEKQGEQKHATIDIDKMVDDYANNKERGNEEFGKPVNCMIRVYRQGLIDAIGKVVLKHAEWSEEDEKVIHCLEYTVKHFYEDGDTIKWCCDWLKSLKDRIQPQPKQEWKQENTSDLTDFENAMMHIGGSFFGENVGLDPNDTNAIKEQAKLLLELAPKQEWNKEDEDILNTIINHFEIDLECTENDDIIKWLKSLKPQNKWKPSDKQIHAFEQVYDWYNNNFAPSETLTSLYNDLKKLRGE